MHSLIVLLVLNCIIMYFIPSLKHNTPPAGSCQGLDHGLEILARMLVRHHLRLNAIKVKQPEDEGVENRSKSKDLSNA
jgi:hypothetical protein